ncbi:MAG: sugar phosphate nucleotidyltransferase [Candidatus Poseidoniales archaeon]|nr:sugar phosphate nucleotidyltransferase [Candidatus Poseidoniales archaeon]
MEMKAVLVAGGHGSRLFPFTRYTHKTLLPLHRRPVIDYALATIRRAGIKDITIIGNQFIGQIAQHVGTGLEGENIHYVIEEEPKGVHHALNLARPHVEGSRILIYFSDNIVTYELDKDVQHWKDSSDPPGCLLLGRTVPDPERFGVAIFGDDGEIVDIVEKPVDPPSAVAIGGIYLYDENFWDIMDEEIEKRGTSFTISDLNRRYVADSKAVLRNIDDYQWFDCGTPDALLEASILAEKGILSPEPCNVRKGDPSPSV